MSETSGTTSSTTSTITHVVASASSTSQWKQPATFSYPLFQQAGRLKKFELRHTNVHSTTEPSPHNLVEYDVIFTEQKKERSHVYYWCTCQQNIHLSRTKHNIIRHIHTQNHRLSQQLSHHLSTSSFSSLAASQSSTRFNGLTHIPSSSSLEPVTQLTLPPALPIGSSSLASEPNPQLTLPNSPSSPTIYITVRPCRVRHYNHAKHMTQSSNNPYIEQQVLERSHNNNSTFDHHKSALIELIGHLFLDTTTAATELIIDPLKQAIHCSSLSSYVPQYIETPTTFLSMIMNAADDTDKDTSSMSIHDKLNQILQLDQLNCISHSTTNSSTTVHSSSRKRKHIDNHDDDYDDDYDDDKKKKRPNTP